MQPRRTTTFTTRMSPELKERIKNGAQSAGITGDAFIARILDEHAAADTRFAAVVVDSLDRLSKIIKAKSKQLEMSVGELREAISKDAIALAEQYHRQEFNSDSLDRDKWTDQHIYEVIEKIMNSRKHTPSI